MQSNFRKPFVASLIEELSGEVSEQIRRTGARRADAEERVALAEGAKARLAAMAAPPFGQHVDSDRELAVNLKAAKERIESLRTKRDVVETRLNNSREQTQRIPAPKKTLTGIIVAAIGMFTFCFAPTVYSAFLSGMDDAVLGWVISIILGAAMGGFLTLLLVNQEGAGPAGRRSSMFGFALGIGCGLLRAAKADSLEGFVVGGALTLIECAAVAGLDWFAHRHREAASAYRISQSQIVALEEAIAAVNSRMAEEEDRYDRLLDQLKQRESEAFDVAVGQEQMEAAVEAEYRSAINANQRRFEGGSLEP